MLTKDDRRFIATLVTDIVTDRVGGLDKKLSARIDGLDKKIDGVNASLSEQIRHNGVLIEDIQSDLKGVAEKISFMDERLIRVENDVTEIKETIFDYPILRETVKKHSRLLAVK
ncbi:hypothetical protein JXA05_01905 [Candidatus Peregrinibacteria bacterium]|nr:hypothetical protein [Candidatus Peregrinibacteria bacterium]